MTEEELREKRLRWEERRGPDGTPNAVPSALPSAQGFVDTTSVRQAIALPRQKQMWWLTYRLMEALAEIDRLRDG